MAWKEIDLDELRGLEEVCRKFIKDYKITCDDQIGQSDDILINAHQLVYDVCEILGYMPVSEAYPGEEDE